MINKENDHLEGLEVMEKRRKIDGNAVNRIQITMKFIYCFRLSRVLVSDDNRENRLLLKE